MPEKKKNCFIIMPLTTPEPFVAQYRDAADHFLHVLRCLFIPGVEMAGYSAISPIAKGSDLIHAGIIKNLESSALVLCDMSCLNANVFFEFGIRTALNKSVCVVKDELTKNVPFDTAILNYQEYKSSLEPWELQDEIKKLADHLRASEERSKGTNTLWTYFGLRSKAHAYTGETGVDTKLEIMGLQLDSLGQKIESLGQQPLSVASGSFHSALRKASLLPQALPSELSEAVSVVKKFFANFKDAVLLNVTINMDDPDSPLLIEYTGSVTRKQMHLLRSILLKEYNLKCAAIRIGDPVPEDERGSSEATGPR